MDNKKISTQKTKRLNNKNPTKTGGELMCTEMVSSSWSTRDTACVTEMTPASYDMKIVLDTSIG